MTPNRSLTHRRGPQTLWLVVLMLVALLALMRPPAAQAATITVAASEVVILENNICSLREAIINANNDAATYDDCAAGSGADTITLAAASTYQFSDSYASYSGATGLPQITTAITIDGNGSTLNRTGGTVRFLAVSGSGNLTLNDLALTNGSMTTDVGGGALYNAGGTVTITNGTFSNNNGSNSQGGGAIRSTGGVITITNTLFSQNESDNSGGGGAIYTAGGAIIVTDSTFSQNNADNTNGGAFSISSPATVSLTGSTLNGNTANGGGAIALNGGSVTLTNATLSGNGSQSAGGGGVYNNGGTVTLNNVTATGNATSGGGGGILSNSGTLNLNRSIVSGNASNSGWDSGYEIVSYGTENANNYNVFGRDGISNNRAFAYSFTPGANDYNATDDGNNIPIGNILNTTLANNGGPTQTHALVAGSPAVDRAPSADCTAAPVSGVDQRGYPRNIDGNATASSNECDAGAFEYLSSPPPTTGTIVIVKDATPADDTPFSFTEDITSGGGTFTLTDPADNTETFSNVLAGAYTVTEDGETGWTLDSISCDDGNSTGNTGTGAASINLEAGETVTCTFANSLDTGTIVIVKEATPADDTPFDFTEDITPGGFALLDPSDNTETFSDVPTGNYTVTETGEAGWTLDDITCDDGNSTGDTNTGAASIALEDGETVTCTFSNSLDTGTIVIVKDATPADDTPFDFTEDITPGGFALLDPSDNTETFSDVPTGNYTVTETGEAGWTLDDITCDDGNSTGDTGTGAASINLEDGETVTCTFSNSLIPPAVPDIFVSATTAGTTGDGVTFGPEDILQWDNGDWSIWFDGTDAGLMPNGKFKHNINALWIPDPAGDDVLMSFTQNARFVDGIPGKVDGMDLVWWDGATWSLTFDGQDVGLTNLTKEKIDALHVLDDSAAPPALLAAAGGSCLRYLLISTQGDGQVTGYDGAVIKFDGTDVLGFCQTAEGATTAGKWIRVLNGKAEGLPGQALVNLSASDDGQVLYLTTRMAINVDSAVGGHSMVYAYDFGTGQFSGPYWSAPAEGLSQAVDGLQVDGALSAP